MLAIGISTGAALIVYKVLGESQKGQVMVENRDDINQIHREVVAKFTDRFACTHTLSKGMNENLEKFPLEIIKNQDNVETLKIPHQFGRIKISELKVLKVERAKNMAELEASYNHKVGGKDFTTQKRFRLELSYKEGAFDGCITKGTLGIDPKDACDLVVGYDASEKSYFYNGKCNFARAVCEQTGREWEEEKLRCKFSEDDLETLRREICATHSLDYNPDEKKCMPSQELIKFVEEFKKQHQKRE